MSGNVTSTSPTYLAEGVLGSPMQCTRSSELNLPYSAAVGFLIIARKDFWSRLTARKGKQRKTFLVARSNVMHADSQYKVVMPTKMLLFEVFRLKYT